MKSMNIQTTHYWLETSAYDTYNLCSKIVWCVVDACQWSPTRECWWTYLENKLTKVEDQYKGYTQLIHVSMLERHFCEYVKQW